MLPQNLDCCINKAANLFITFDISEIKFLNFLGGGNFKNISLDIAMKKRGIFLPPFSKLLF